MAIGDRHASGCDICDCGKDYDQSCKEVSDRVQNIVEMIVEMLDKMVESSMGPYAKKFRNYTGSIFIFIFLSNISGLFGLRPPTADYGVTLPLGLLTFGIIQYNNIKYNKFGAFTGLLSRFRFCFRSI